MPTYQIKTETADLLRAAAPRLGLTPAPSREMVGPGLEALHLPDLTAAAFDMKRKAAKVSADVLIKRILNQV